MSYWQDKIVLVTGGSNGLGRVIAETFGAAGAKLAIAGLEPNDVEKTAEEMNARGIEVLPLVANVTKPEDAKRIVEETVARYGGLDALVNAAGRTHRGYLMKTPLQEFDDLWRLNVLGTIACTQAAYPHLIEHRGHVVNIGSLAAKSAARWVRVLATVAPRIGAGRTARPPRVPRSRKKGQSPTLRVERGGRNPGVGAHARRRRQGRQDRPEKTRAKNTQEMREKKPRTRRPRKGASSLRHRAAMSETWRLDRFEINLIQTRLTQKFGRFARRRPI